MDFEKINLEPTKEEPYVPKEPEKAEKQPETAAREPTGKEVLERLPDLSDIKVPIETGSLGRRIDKMQEERRLEAEQKETKKQEVETAKKQAQRAELQEKLSDLLKEEEREFMDNESYPRIVEAAITRIVRAGGKTKELVEAGISSRKEQVAVQDPVLDGCVAAMVENPVLAANFAAAVERFTLETATNFKRGGVSLYDPENLSRREKQEAAILPGLFQGRDPETKQQLRELIAETVREAERDRREAEAESPSNGKAYFKPGEWFPPIRKMGSAELSDIHGWFPDHSDLTSVAELAGTVSKGIKKVFVGGKGPEDKASRQRSQILDASAMVLREVADGRTAVETGRGKFLADARRLGTPLSPRNQTELEWVTRMRNAKNIARNLEAL